jgi:hypothetical protein
VRIRLATLMTGRPTTLALLQQRSGLAQQDCLDFLVDLRRAELLESTRPAEAPAAPAPAPEAAPVESRPATLARDPVQPGLLARIRNRLGLLPTGSR